MEWESFFITKVWKLDEVFLSGRISDFPFGDLGVEFFMDLNTFVLEGV